MKKQKVRSNRPLTFENLEARLPLAGEILLKTSGGSLTITGTDDVNNITVVQDAAVAGKFTITGNGGETFKLNGAAFVSGSAVEGVTKDIKVDLKKGNDIFTIKSVAAATIDTARNITIKTKGGADVVTVQNLKITGNLAIDTGSGDVAADNDIVNITDLVSVGKNVAVKTGKGADDVIYASAAASTVGGTVNINTGSGDDATGGDLVDVNNIDITKSLTISTGKGDDDVVVQAGKVTGNASIKTGTEEDQVDTKGAQEFGKNLTINTGNAGAAKIDTVNIIGLTKVVGNTSVTTGDGNDVVNVDGATAAKTTLKTGKGNDDVNIATTLAVAIDQALVNLGAGDDTIDIGVVAALTLNGPKITKLNGGAGADKLTSGAGTKLLGAGALTAKLTAIETEDIP